MKKIFLTAMAAMIMVACDSETPEVPGNKTSNEENKTEKPEGQKKNPSMTDVIGIHQSVAKALDNKPTASKVDLTDYAKGFSLTKSTCKNNKYKLEFADGTVSVLDLNNYESKNENRSTTGSRSNAASRSEEENDSTFSNSKVLVWEAAPFGTVLTDDAHQLLLNYMGKDNVKTMSGADCTWQSLMEMSEYAVVIFNGLGVDGGWIVTGQEYTDALDYSSVKEYIGIYSAVVDGQLKNYYMVTDAFISKFIAPMVKKGLVFNASASGADGNGLAKAFATIGYPAYVGLDSMPDEEWTTSMTEIFLTSLFADRTSTGDAYALVEEEHQYTDALGKEVKVGFKMEGEQSLYAPYTEFTDRMAVTRILENYGVDGKYTFESLVEDNKIVLDYYGRINMLDLSDMGLEGEIEPLFTWMDQLYLLNLNDNKLSGDIPAFLGEYPNLTSLMMSNNELTGNIPATFKKLYENGGVVSLTNNKMNGQIPFGKYADNNIMFRFDHKYQYDNDGTVTENEHGLWFSDEPVK